MRTSTLSPLAEEVLAIAGAPLERAFALPPACYVDPGFLALEHEVLFAREWLCVGRAADIPQPGDYAAYDSPVGPVMAVRQKDGSIATLSRVCRHRGALVGEDGSGSARLFTCPYHKWVYELDGRLRGAPAMGGNPAFAPADRARAGLCRRDAPSCNLLQYWQDSWHWDSKYREKEAAQNTHKP